MSEDSSANQLEQLMALAVSLHSGQADLKPRLLPGRIPEDCPLQIPVPPHTRLLGTLAHDNLLYVIMLQCNLPLSEALSSYRTQLAALDWKERVLSKQRPTDESPQRGYRPAVLRLMFFHPPNRAWLSLVEREDATTLVRLEVYLSKEGTPDAQPEEPEQPAPRDFLGPRHRAVHLLPTLFAPADAQLRFQDSHVGPEEVEMTSEVATPLDPVALAQHYTEQLSRAWTQTEAGGRGPFVWSTWQFTSTDPEPAPWSALLLILKMPDKPIPDHYTLKLWAFRSKPEASQ
ncbi:MAG: hypothetical protein ACLQUY_14670 [Ktedonobacterales bacterium]